MMQAVKQLTCLFIMVMSCQLFGKEVKADRAYIEYGAGLSILNVPHYSGSDEYETYAIPFPYFIYETEKVSLNRDGLRRHLFYSDTWDIDFSFAGRLPVRDDNKARIGMPELDWVLLAGPSINYKLINEDRHTLKLTLPARAGLATDFGSIGSVGWEAAPGIQWDGIMVDEAVQWRTRLSANWFYGDKKFNDYYYSVAPEYATADRPTYVADAGSAGYQLTFALTRREGAYWYGGFVRYRSLENASFADSPLVKQKDNVFVGFGFAYIFEREYIGD